MLFKLAIRNIRRSLRDYVIYFVTLVLGVALFYAFNSIESQQVLFDFESKASARMFDQMSYFMGMVSVVIACVLGFLVLYSNRFLIRRRKRELGTYEVLGMSGGQVARILLIETVIVGLASLAVGLIAGVLASQGLSFVTGALFGAVIQNYQFVFSPGACMSTLACFAVIFVLVAIFNVITVSRYRLITLLHADSQNEKAPVRNPWVCLAVFIGSIAVLAFAYEQLIESQMIMMDDPRFLRATLAMLVGSLGFFWSIAGFVVAVIPRLRGFYLRGLRPFTLRQIASRVNSAFLSLWAVCVLLFFSITVFSTGMGLVNVFVGDVKAANPYDATLQADVWWSNFAERQRATSDTIEGRALAMEASEPELYAEGEAYGWAMADKLRDGAPELWAATVGKAAQLDVYEVPGVTYAGTLGSAHAQEMADAESSIGSALAQNIIVASVSQVNGLRALTGLEPISLEDGRYRMANNTTFTENFARSFIEDSIELSLNGFALRPDPEILAMQMDDNAMLSCSMVVVVPDAVTESLVSAGALPRFSYLDIMYADNGKTAVQNYLELERIVAASQPYTGDERVEGDEVRYDMGLWPVSMAVSGEEMIAQSGGLRMLIIYLALYIGFIFLISTAAILAIQQLSDAVDSQSRYRMLWRLGVDGRSLNRSLLAQVLIYFLVPLGLALCHAACAIGVLNDQLFSLFGVDPLGSIGLCALLVLIIYGGYMAITYLTARSLMRPSLRSS